MPTSDPEGKEWAADVIRRIAPATVVDIGPGEGTYARLARDHTPGARWIAVEAWGPYVTGYGLWELYDHVVLGDVRHVDLMSLDYAPTLAICGDMLEHLPAEEVPVLVQRLQAWADHLLVSVPIVHHPQGAVGGNWMEIHRSEWTAESMRNLLQPGVVEERVGDVLAYFHWMRG